MKYRSRYTEARALVRHKTGNELLQITRADEFIPRPYQSHFSTFVPRCYQVVDNFFQFIIWLDFYIISGSFSAMCISIDFEYRQIDLKPIKRIHHMSKFWLCFQRIAISVNFPSSKLMNIFPRKLDRFLMVNIGKLCWHTNTPSILNGIGN